MSSSDQTSSVVSTAALAQDSAQSSGPTVYLDPSENIGSIVSGSAAGTTFIFAPGVYSNVSINPKNDDSFIGENGVTLTGSVPITGWTQSGGYWVASGFPAPGISTGVANAGRDGLAQVPEDLYVNGVPYLRVGSLADDAAGDFYYSNGQVYISTNPSGQTTTASTTAAAFNGDDTIGVTVKDMTLEQYASSSQHGAIEAHGSSGWNVVDVNAIDNHAAGIAGGNNMTITGGNYSNDGEEGIEDYSASNVVINGVTADNNNWAGYSTGWDAGGIKIITSNNVTIENSDISNNSGFGLWFDTNNQNISVLNNNISNNEDLGLYYEASQNATISGNRFAYDAQNGYITGYWGAGLLLQDSQYATVTQNLVIANGGEGIGMQDDPRQPDINNTVDDNTIVMLQTGLNGGASDGGSDSQIFNGSSVWNGNTFVAQSAGNLEFTWDNQYWVGPSTLMDPNATYVYRNQPLSYVQPIVAITSETLAGVAVPSGGATGSGVVALAGTSSGLTALTVEIYDGSTLLGSATVGGSGAWTYSTTLGSGTQTLDAVATDSYGDSTTSATAPPITVSSQGGGGGGGPSGPISVAAYLADPSAADSQSGGVEILDTAAHIAAQFDALNADSHIASITISDGGALLLTVAQALDDTGTIAKFASAPTIIVSDTAANLLLLTAAQIAVLDAEGVTRLNATDQDVPFTSAQRQALGAADIALEEPYSTGMTELVVYNSAGAIPEIKYWGVTGEPYTSYIVNYGANSQILSADYNNGMIKTWSYNANGSYVVTATGVTGQSYTSYTLDVAANGQDENASFSNGMTENWTYNADGSFKVVAAGVTGQPYTSFTIFCESNGDPVSATYSNGMTKTWIYNSDSSFESVTANVSGEPYSSVESAYDVNGFNFETQEDLTNNSGYATLNGNGLTTNSGGGFFGLYNGSDNFWVPNHTDQTIDATGFNSETFGFAAGFGQDTIDGLVATGAKADVVQFFTSMFKYLNTSMSQGAQTSAVLSHAQQVGANVAITDSGSDTLTLSNVTIATLTANPGDFRFIS